MKRIKTLLLSTLFISSLAQAQAPNWERKANCDVPAESFKTLKSVSQEECQQGCAGEQKCKGFVYITGWKRCLLKEDMKRPATLRFISGELDAKHTFDPKDLRADADHTGKDLERKVLEKPEMCAKACTDRQDCAAFTFLEGYRVCWLKAGGGRFLDKIFHCGIKGS